MGEVVRQLPKTTGAIVGCVAILLGLGFWAPTALGAPPRTTSPAIPPGVYSGTVRMSGVNNCVTKRCLVTLTGTWSVTVDGADQVRGSETMADNIVFTPGKGCSDSPRSWTLSFSAALGKLNSSQSDLGAPGFVHGSEVFVSVNSSYNDWTGWKGSPAKYTRTCGSDSASWPIGQQYGWPGEDTGWTSAYTARLPIGLFRTRGHPYTVPIKGGSPYHRDTFEQTYTLTAIHVS
jgi:hypothetical protein